ncbi:MAG: hypothetical protein JSS44_11345 [Proteobacteria bacterium]|nr:hypothetical protein [Pseudomonadota bacterium]
MHSPHSDPDNHEELFVIGWARTGKTQDIACFIKPLVLPFDDTGAREFYTEMLEQLIATEKSGDQ